MKKLILILLLLLPVTAKQVDLDVARLSKELEKIRGLKFSHPVPSEAQSQAQVTKYLQGLFDQEADRTPYAIRQAFLHQAGLLPLGVEYRKSLRDLYSEQVRGLYDPYKKRFLVVSGKSAPGGQEAAMQGMLAAQGMNISMDDILTIHELDHALQDQHFNLQKIDKATAPNFDQAFAAQCLIEGDATLVMMDYMAASMGIDPGMLDSMTGGDDGGLLAGAGMPSGSNAPAFIQKLISDPYFQGMSFCRALRGQGGWGKVDGAYRRLPASSEQVLHPDRYTRNDVPVTLNVSMPAPPAGWKYLGCDVAGEYLIRAMGDANAAEGWGGDLYCSYGRGYQEGLVWLTAWDTEKDAKEFQAMAEKLVARGGVAGLVNRVERKKNKVLVLRNAPPKVAPAF